jgi:hypothetical protein
MVRALVKNGIIQPLEPLPSDWEDGREVVVDDLVEQTSNGAAEMDAWAKDMNALTAELNDPQEWQEIEAALAEADRQNKALVRREMGLP